MKFYPLVESTKTADGREWYEKLGDAALSSAKRMTKNLANNLTGGLLGSIMNNKVEIEKCRQKNSGCGKTSFMEYLAAANLLVGQEDWVGEKAGQAIRPLELQLGLYCQEVTLPDFEIPVGSSSQSAIGEFPINGVYVKPTSQVLNMQILNTKVPLFERLFYPWMREVVLPWWSYGSQPYTTATITVDMTKHSDVKYVFYGCRPQTIKAMQAAQQPDPQNKQRQIAFLYDYMMVQSSYKNVEEWTEKLLGTAKTLFNAAGGMMNL